MTPLVLHIKGAEEFGALLTALQGAPEEAAMKDRIGRRVVRVTKKHLLDLDSTRPNALGGERTHFYADAAEHVSYTPAAHGVTLTVDKQGMAQRFYGGMIEAVHAAALTIPIDPRAHGRTTKEFEAATGLKLFRLPSRDDRAEGEGLLVVEDESGGVDPIYALRKRLSKPQKPDRTVMPSDEVLITSAAEAIDTFLREIISN